MSKGKGLDITRVSREAWNLVAKLESSASEPLQAVALDRCAKQMGITRIRVEPIMSAAGLARGSDGLEVVLNTESPGVKEAAETIMSVDDGSWGRLVPPLRFTVAHEIAHAAFLIAADKNQESSVFQKNRGSVETACSILARAILLPRQMLLREVHDRVLDIGQVHNLISAFKVSPEVFIRRLHLSDVRSQLGDTDGFLALATERDANLRIKACHIMGDHSTPRFQGDKTIVIQHEGLATEYYEAHWVMENSPVDDLGLDQGIISATTLRSTNDFDTKTELSIGANSILPCEFSSRSVSHRPLGVLMMLRATGSVEKRGQQRLL